MANELTFSQQLGNSLAEVKEALPINFNNERFVQNAIALLNGNSTLSNYVQQYGRTGQMKVIMGLKRGAFLNLDFLSSEAYLIPYKADLQFMPSYKGEIKMCKEYSTRPIKNIYSKIVRSGDLFEETIVNGEPSVTFKPVPFSNEPIIGAFAVIQFVDGTMMVDTMSKEEIENTRRQSKMANGPTWKNFYTEMAKKTVIRRLCKTIDLNLDANQRQIYDETMAINAQTSPEDIKEEVMAEIELNANSEEFIVEG